PGHVSSHVRSSPEADVNSASWLGRNVPEAAVSRCGRQPLFDHLVGAAEQRQWQCDADCVCGIEVDHQFDLYRLLYREHSRLLAFEHSAYIDGGLPPRFRNISPVAHQAASGREFAPLRDCWQSMPCSPHNKLAAPAKEEVVGADQDGTGP